MSKDGSPLQYLLHQQPTHPLIPTHHLEHPPLVFKLSRPSDFSGINPCDTAAMISRTQQLLLRHNASWAVGRYGEQRELYQHERFKQPIRDVHLGLDITLEAGTELLVPYTGICHSFANNNGAGDYGPTVILQHRINTQTFYSLYGHLSEASLEALHPGKLLTIGSHLGHIGSQDENGGWPPHVHVQLITDIGKYRGDFPGVCAHTNKNQWLTRCPNPNWLLKLPYIE